MKYNAHMRMASVKQKIQIKLIRQVKLGIYSVRWEFRSKGLNKESLEGRI